MRKRERERGSEEAREGESEGGREVQTSYITSDDYFM